MTQHYYQPNLQDTVQEVMHGMHNRFTSTTLLQRLQAHSEVEHGYSPSYRDMELLRRRVLSVLDILQQQGKIKQEVKFDTPTKTPITHITKL